MKPMNYLLACRMSDRQRYLRIALGVGLLVVAVALPTSWGWLGIYPLITGLTGTTPIFNMLGVGPRA